MSKLVNSHNLSKFFNSPNISNKSAKIKIVEVGPRDGLQNESKLLSTEIKTEFINLLSQTGLKYIEAGSYVSPKSIPQMHDTDLVLKNISKNNNINYSVLVPNDIGLNKALECMDYRPSSIAVFTAASESFCKNNINCTISDSLNRFEKIIQHSLDNNIPVRGYISCVMGCPYEGEINLNKVVDIANSLYQMGCYEISLGDTIGVGSIIKVKKLINLITRNINIDKIAVHFHDTYGQALVNVYAAMEEGVSIIDSATAGLGGCPYAKGSSGNLATEDLLYMLNNLNIETNIDLEKIITAGEYICNKLNIISRSKVALAYNNVCKA